MEDSAFEINQYRGDSHSLQSFSCVYSTDNESAAGPCDVSSFEWGEGFGRMTGGRNSWEVLALTACDGTSSEQ